MLRRFRSRKTPTNGSLSNDDIERNHSENGVLSFNNNKKDYEDGENRFHSYNVDDDGDHEKKYSKARSMSSLPSGALYGGCYYPKKHVRRRRRFPRLYVFGGFVCLLVCLFLLSSGLIFSSGKQRGDIRDMEELDNGVPGVKLRPVEELRQIELDKQMNQIKTMNSRERLDEFRRRVPGWENSGQITLHNMDTSGSCAPIDHAMLSVSLVSQGSIDRLWIMEETCKRWKDPIIVVLYIKGERNEDNYSWKNTYDWKNSCPQLKIIPYYGGSEIDPGKYPVNKLRNIGLDALETYHYLMVDIDFVPSEQLGVSIHESFQHVTGNRDAMVVPAFEKWDMRYHEATDQYHQIFHEDPNFIPSIFDELKKCMNAARDQPRCYVFQRIFNPPGHETTKSEEWLEKKWMVNGKPRSIHCFEGDRYEPYVLLRWCSGSTPYYDERFEGYGKNKIEYIAHLRYVGYQFIVLPGPGFIIHVPHEQSSAKNSWIENDNGLHKNMDELYYNFLKDLREKYKKSDHLHIC